MYVQNYQTIKVFVMRHFIWTHFICSLKYFFLLPERGLTWHWLTKLELWARSFCVSCRCLCRCSISAFCFFTVANNEVFSSSNLKYIQPYFKIHFFTYHILNATFFYSLSFSCQVSITFPCDIFTEVYYYTLFLSAIKTISCPFPFFLESSSSSSSLLVFSCLKCPN